MKTRHFASALPIGLALLGLSLWLAVTANQAPQFINNASAAGRTLPDDAHFNATAAAQQQATALVADYQFQTVRSSSVGTPPALTDVSANTFDTSDIDDSNRIALFFNQGSGLKLAPTTGVIPNQTYTIVLLFSYNDVSNFRRILDFKNGTSSGGLIFDNGRLAFAFANSFFLKSGTAVFGQNTFVQVVVTRNSSGVVNCYANGLFQFSFPDTNNDAVIDSNNTLFFFRPRPGTDSGSAGKVARIRLYNDVLSPSQITSLDRLPNLSPGCPSVSDLDPAIGLPGSNFNINGSGLAGIISIKFPNDLAATIVSNNGTQLKAQVPVGAKTGTLTLSKASCDVTTTAVFVIAGLQLPHGTPVADFQFQDIRTSAVGSFIAIGRPPALIDLGRNSFGLITVDNTQRRGLLFGPNQGLVLFSTAGVVPNNAYSIVALFAVDNVGTNNNNRVRILDFKNGSSDSGLFISNGGLEFVRSDSFSTVRGANPIPIAAKNFVQVTLTRDQNKTVNCYVNGQLDFAFVDNADDTVIEANTLRFFRTNTGANTASSGQIARLRLFNDLLSPSEVAALARLPQTLPAIALTPKPQTIQAGKTGQFTVTLSTAQQSNTVVTLTSANPNVVTVPASVTINAGSTTAVFNATGVATGGPVTITATLPASLGSGSDTASVTVIPMPTTAITLTPKTQTIQKGQAGALTVTLSAAQQTNTTVTLNSANAGVVTVPATVTINAGATTVNFNATGVAAGGPVTITATLPQALGSTSDTASVTVTMNPMITLTPKAQTIQVGQSGQFTATLSTAQQGNTIVTLSSANTSIVTVPTSVTINAGATTATFNATGVTAGGPVTITATLPQSLGGGSDMANATIAASFQILSVTPLETPIANKPFRLRIEGTGFDPAKLEIVFLGAGCLAESPCVITNDKLTSKSATRIESLTPALAEGTFDVHVRNGSSAPLSNCLPLTISPLVVGVSAANYRTEVAADSIIALFCRKLANGVSSANNLPLPTTLAGTSVKIRGTLAELFFVSPTQINARIPPGTTAGTATITVMIGSEVVGSGEMPIANVAPGLFTANANGQGVPAGVALRVRANGIMQVYEPISRLDPATNRHVPVPIDLGQAGERVFLILFGTGIRFRSSLNAVTATIGGSNAEVSFAGKPGALVGLDQVNVEVPRILAGRGNVDIILKVDGKAANTVQVSIK